MLENPTTVRYYVIDANGARYGPADANLLNHWAGEGRLAPQSMLVEEATGRQIPASSIPGLRFLPMGTPPGSPFSPTTGAPYGATPFNATPNGTSDANISLGLSMASFVLCCCLPLIGLLPSFAAVYYARLALQKGARTGRTAYNLAVVSILAQILYAVLSATVLRALMKGL